MKFFLPLVIFFAALNVGAQDHFCAKAKRASAVSRMQQQAREASITSLTSHELEYDVKFVFLDLSLERNTKFIKGGVTTVATVTAATLDTFMTLLHQNHSIDSLRFNGLLLPAIRQDSMVKVKLPAPLSSGASFTVVIYYKGTAPTGGAAIGSGFNTGVSGSWGNQTSWSLSESIVAYHWWPCKQILTDKIDSSWVFVTTDSANKVGSNGLLKNITLLGNKKRYEWKSRNLIDYYLISVSVAKYKEYNLYAKPLYLPNDSILIQNYIYDNAINNNTWINSQKVQLNKLPQVLNFFCKMYGMYPFRNEKYGHCMAPFSGGMEHQTMTTLGFFDYYVDAHELGHQWWGDNVTCKGWADIWINEAFAVYSEYITSRYLDSANFAAKLNGDHNYVMSQPGGSVYFTNQDTLDANVIFDDRLTYAKGGSIIRTLQFVTNNDSLWFNTLRGFQVLHKGSTASVIDFKNYYQAQTGINPTQFFNQWYYGQGYPTFTVKYGVTGTTCVISATQTVSEPAITPLYITPMEYKIKRSGFADTTVRVMHANAIESYSFNVRGTVLSLVCDPNNWVINKVIGPTREDSTTTVGINQLGGAAYGLQVGPNPSKGIFVISNTGGISGQAQVFDLGGRLLVKKALEAETGIDLGAYPAGMYLLKIMNEKGSEVYSQKLVRD